MSTKSSKSLRERQIKQRRDSFYRIRTQGFDYESDHESFIVTKDEWAHGLRVVFERNSTGAAQIKSENDIFMYPNHLEVYYLGEPSYLQKRIVDDLSVKYSDLIAE